MNTIALQSARIRLSGAIGRLARNEVAETRVRMLPIHNAPDTWEALQAVDLNTGVLPVWNGASHQTVYLSSHANYLFRYWHDMGHLFYGLSFVPEHEYTLQHEYHLPMVAAVLGRDSLAYQLYYADTVGQIDYVTTHKRFPTNQLAFAAAYVQDKSKSLDSVF